MLFYTCQSVVDMTLMDYSKQTPLAWTHMTNVNCGHLHHV